MSTTQELHERFEPRPDAKALTRDDNDTHSVQKDADFEPHPEKSLRISDAHQSIITRITNLYGGSASEADMQVYDEKAIYDDPLSYCDTRYKIAGQWYGLPKIFSKLETKATEVVKDNDEEIVFKMRHEYTLKGVHASRKVDSLVSLGLDPNGKVKYHKDMWNEKDYSHEGFGKFIKKLNGDKLTGISQPPESL